MSRRPLIAVFLAALAVRAVFLWQWRETPYYLTPRLDDKIHQLWAAQILDGGLLRHTAFYQSPFYPYFLAAFYKAFGFKPAWILWLQALASALSCALIAATARRAFWPSAGLAAGLLAAFYWPSVMYTGFFLKETFLMLGLSLFAWVAVARPTAHFLSGLLLGLSALSRGAALWLAAAVPGLWTRKSLPKFAAGAALMILPATLHNFLASRDLVLINYTNGFSFYIGNNPEARGNTHYPSGYSSHPWGEELAVVQRGLAVLGPEAKPSQISRYFFKQGLRFILEHPGQWLSLTAMKLVLFWNWYEMPDNYNLYFIREQTRTIASWALPSFLWIGPLSLIGAFAFWGSRPQARPLAFFALLYMASVVLTFVNERYRLPCTVFLFPFAGAALSRLRRPGELSLGALRALPLLVVCLFPVFTYTARDRTQGWVDLCEVHYERGDYRKSFESFYQALLSSAEDLDPEGFMAGARAAERLGLKEQALQIYDGGLELHPESRMLKRHRLRLLEKK